VAEHSLCKRKVVGSIPACGCFPVFSTLGSHGVVVSISGCDPLDPGSNPGAANFFVTARCPSG
jgi:hypothetical protein